MNELLLNRLLAVRSLTIAVVLCCAVSANAGTLDPELAKEVASATSSREIGVIVKMKQGIDHVALLASLQGETRHARVAKVVQALKDNAERSQQKIRGDIASKKSIGKVKGVRQFWIFNGFALKATPDAILELAARDDVNEVVPDRVLTLATPPIETAAAAGIWNLDIIGAPLLWSKGFTGQGIVVASLDTGVDITHPALASKWRGGVTDWFDPYNNTTTPYDVDGHGTATMGIMTAGNTSDNPVGVAPGATWIAAKIFDDSGHALTSSIHAAFQWVMNPDGNAATQDAPDVVNNSWDLGNTGGYDTEFLTDIQNLKAAGIEVVFSAGNSGPFANTSTSPGNYPGAISVGATDQNDLIASFSSRGPSPAGGSSVFPVLVAPGVRIRSTGLNGTYGTLANNGTSFSAPHVAGAYALLKSAIPGLTMQQAEDALLNSVVGANGPDNTYGYGRLDVGKAYSYLTMPGDLNGDGKIDAADLLMLLRVIVGRTAATPLITKNGDVFPLGSNGAPHGDGSITIHDAIVILQRVVGLITW